jgi:hypothetical protein
MMDTICLIDRIGHFLAPWATVFGVAFGIVMISIGLKTIKSNNEVKRMELISKIYNRFLNDELYEFYIRIRNNEFINWQNDRNDERLLNKSLTLFDEVNYLRTQKLLDIKAWEYIAGEIQYFALNDSVWDYMIQRIRDCRNRGFPADIAPFTGFPELLNEVPEKFRATPFPVVPHRYNALFNTPPSSQSSS